MTTSADTPDTVAWNDSPNSSPEIVMLEADLEALNRLRSASDLERRVGNQLLELDRVMTASDHEGYLHQSARSTLIRNLVLQKRAKHDQKLLNAIEALHGIDNNPAHPAQLTGHQLDVELQHSIIIKRQAEIDAERKANAEYDEMNRFLREVEDEVKRIEATLPEPLNSEKRQVLKFSIVQARQARLDAGIAKSNQLASLLLAGESDDETKAEIDRLSEEVFAIALALQAVSDLRFLFTSFTSSRLSYKGGADPIYSLFPWLLFSACHDQQFFSITGMKKKPRKSFTMRPTPPPSDMSIGPMLNTKMLAAGLEEETKVVLAAMKYQNMLSISAVNVKSFLTAIITEFTGEGRDKAGLSIGELDVSRGCLYRDEGQHSGHISSILPPPVLTQKQRIEEVMKLYQMRPLSTIDRDEIEVNSAYFLKQLLLSLLDKTQLMKRQLYVVKSALQEQQQAIRTLEERKNEIVLMQLALKLHFHCPIQDIHVDSKGLKADSMGARSLKAIKDTFVADALTLTGNIEAKERLVALSEFLWGLNPLTFSSATPATPTANEGQRSELECGSPSLFFALNSEHWAVSYHGEFPPWQKCSKEDTLMEPANRSRQGSLCQFISLDLKISPDSLYLQETGSWEIMEGIVDVGGQFLCRYESSSFISLMQNVYYDTDDAVCHREFAKWKAKALVCTLALEINLAVNGIRFQARAEPYIGVEGDVDLPALIV
ncbi:hypothetical protein C8J56DRAFT_901227 [Mycena floridula]|nr:hypothetical protein C8J56DRAFT_901227 [Mycena floridula]